MASFVLLVLGRVDGRLTGDSGKGYISLLRFFTNPFDDLKISLNELLAFATDHLQRMIANNPGSILAERIVATTASLGVVESCTTDNMVKLSLRKAKKIAKNSFRDALPVNIQSIYGMVLANYAQNSPEMAEIFGEGRGVFDKCADDKLKMHLEATLVGVTAHVGVLGAPLVANVTGLLTTWNALYAASESSTGEATTTQEGKLAARLALQLDLYKNLATMMLNFPAMPEKLPMYMRQDLLEDHPAGLPLPLQAQISLDAPSGPGHAAFTTSSEGAVTVTVWYRLMGAPDFTELATEVPLGAYETPVLPAGNYEFKVAGVNETGTGPESEVAGVTIV